MEIRIYLKPIYLILSKNLYGRRLEFHIISKIRETKKFKGIEELKDSIDNDINSAKKIFKIK